MLKIKNASGEELMTLHDDGTEDIKDQKLKEQMEQGVKITEQEDK
ncbi:hypothetical protein ACK8P5_26555 (plasmid) [Paenibacillus sp. EC2-1]